MVAYLKPKKNKRIWQISGLKSDRGRFRNLKSGRLREVLKQHLSEKQNDYFQSGRLREVVAVRDLTEVLVQIT